MRILGFQGRARSRLPQQHPRFTSSIEGFITLTAECLIWECGHQSIDGLQTYGLLLNFDPLTVITVLFEKDFSSKEAIALLLE